MNQNEIQQTDYRENWENNELDIEYWEEEYSSQSENECLFTMCFCPRIPVDCINTY